MPRWEQGEHIALVGDTGSGKTFLLARLLEYRSYTVVLRTKDDAIRFKGAKRVTKASQLDISANQNEAHYLLDPPYARQAYEGYRLMERVWAEGGWTIALDELWYIEQELRLSRSVNRLLTQGRSLGISVIAGMQRPAQISRFTLSQATHLFAFASEGRDIQTLAEAFTPRLKDIVPRLRRYEFVYYYRPERFITTGYAQNLGKLLGGT